VTIGLFLAALDPGAKIIPLVNGRGFTVVSVGDFERLKHLRWRNHRYVDYFDSSTKSNVQMARLILDVPEGLLPDHINREKFDNRRCNLRLATKPQQTFNRPKYKKHKLTSGFKGVSLGRYGKWCACITHGNKHYYLGSFDVEIEAAKAYNKAAVKLHGQFAAVNQIHGDTGVDEADEFKSPNVANLDLSGILNVDPAATPTSGSIRPLTSAMTHHRSGTW
jgi:hypothetical protein